MTESELVQLEMDYTTWHDSCLDPYLDGSQETRQCRRSRGHIFDPSRPYHHLHASGLPLTFWPDPPALSGPEFDLA